MEDVTTVTEMKLIDWGTHSLAIGVRLPGGGEPWEAFSLEDLRILRALLRKRLEINNSPLGPLTEISKSFEKLAAWCDSVIEWSQNKDTRVLRSNV